ncbi:FYDLN acid domain-containing protein [Sphingomonas sp. 37zxx]|uniref:FYDLN acid domain-containing protein n=1 Tax=Sphingomonas sp. 37zxx TaxID=1550073 RepID=UPI00053BDE15|nr:FYDLN acid domain-containing protein [Sphingomonas sp. 37zxx]
MVKPEWGTKRACPKCGTRFYDLGKEDPVSCIACGVTWNPEPILKSKQPLPFEAAKAAPMKEKDEDSDLGEDLDVEDDDTPADDDVDLGGDEDLGVETPSDEHET